MKWRRADRFLSTFLIILGVCTAGAAWFVFSARSDWDDATIRFDGTAAELNRLERLALYPSSENLRTMKAHAEDYASALTRLRDELKTRVFPPRPMAPNEFQSHLRLTITAAADKARAHKVKLPDKFYLGFDEFVSALPSEAAAPLLGQELAQIESLLDALLEARVDALTSFRRTPLPEEGRNPAMALAGPEALERNVVEATFVSTPAAARKALNQIAGTSEQFFIVRLLHVRNEQDKGPPRELTTDAAGAQEAKAASATALNFIVGTERIETSARIEIVRFRF